MNYLQRASGFPLLMRWMQVLLLAFLAAGCNREEIRSYRAQKDEAPPVAMGGHGPGDGHDHGEAPRPELAWKLPAGWRETDTDAINLKGFVVAGPNGTEARISITRLVDFSGRDTMLVNLWRQQVGLPQLSDEDALKALEPVDFGTGKGKLFEVAGVDRQTNAFKITTAFLHRPDGSWFCKLAGSASLVTEQKSAFIEFLKSIEIKEPARTETTSAPGQFGWSVPEQWTKVAPGQMQDARFTVPEKDGAKADVTVSIFPTDTGGTLANVNRWRRQIGLGELAETDLGQVASPLDATMPGAILVDMSSNDKRLIGAIVPRDGKFWFYKLMGDGMAVAPQREAFIVFARSKP